MEAPTRGLGMGGKARCRSHTIRGRTQNRVDVEALRGREIDLRMDERQGKKLQASVHHQFIHESLLPKKAWTT